MNVELARRLILLRERRRAPRPQSDLELDKVELCMWTGADQFRILPPEDESKPDT